MACQSPAGKERLYYLADADRKNDFYPTSEDRITRRVVNQGKIGTNQEGKKANRPPWGAIGLLAVRVMVIILQMQPKRAVNTRPVAWPQ
jgi:hypothetical protein